MIDPHEYLNHPAHPAADPRHAALDAVLDHHRDAEKDRARRDARKKKWQGYTSWLALVVGLALSTISLWDKLIGWLR